MKTAARFFRHLVFASALVAGFVWLAPWRLLAPPPEPQKPQRIQRLLYPTFHLRPHEDPYRDSIYNPVLQASRPIDVGMAPLQSDLGFYLVPGDPLPWNDQYMGRKVRLYNNTREIKNVPTSDYALFVIAEAMDSEGRWRAIEEYLAISCDFSYFTVELEPYHYWEFTVPIYEGSFRTRMRYALSMGGDLIIYSEEFDSSIEPELLGIAYGVEADRPKPRIVWKMTGGTQPL